MSDRRALLARSAPLLLLLVLAGATLLRPDAGLRLASTDASGSRDIRSAVDRLTEDAVVLVAFDPDLGTYAEIRPTVRALIADLLGRGVRLAFLSLTPEGRALALAELGRMDRLEANPRQIVDLGFLPGGEAALVGLARELGPEPADDAITALPVGEGLSAPALALVVGGNDLGPRSWIEQVAPRTEGIEIVAVAPTVLLPELQPYVSSGQLSGLLATPRDGAEYRASVELGPLERLEEPAEPATLAILAGVLVAIGMLGQSVGARLSSLVRAARAREAA